MFDAEDEVQHNKIVTIENLAMNISNASKPISKIFEEKADFTRILILGNTGIGKSTMANALIGKKILVKKNNHDNLYLHCEDPSFEIGNQMISMTTIPNIYVDEIQRLIICDAAGFNDVRGPNQEIFNAFLIDQLFTSPCNVKILLVLSEGDISIEGKGVKALENFQRLSRILPDKKQFKQSIGLVLSQINEEITPKKYLQQLMNGNPNEDIKKMSKFFISNSKSRLFSFPRAKYEHVDKVYIFKDRFRLLEFLHASPVHNPIHKVVLSEGAKENIQKVSDLIGSFDGIVKNIILKLRTGYDIENISIEQLNEWKNSYNKIIENVQVKIPIDLISLLQENISNISIISEYIDQIKCYNYMYMFKNHIDNFIQKDKFTNFSEIVRNEFEKEIIELINVKIKLKGEEANFEKGEQSRQLIQIQMDSIQKSHDANKVKYDYLSSSNNILNCQLEQEKTKSKELTEKVDKLNKKLLEQQKKADEYGESIKNLLKKIDENEEMSKKEIADLEKQLKEKVKYYEKIINDQTKEYQLESIGKYLGPIAPLWSFGVNLYSLIKNHIENKYY